MTLPLTGQPTRDELVAELYDRHAAGLFAYFSDQLGDHGSAADALVSVLTSVSTVEPPRASMYALARREIFRRDVVYAPPVIDPLVDPATAMVERTLRDLRPHQREVLLLSVVCGLSDLELAWVLDVAPDTAGELADSASNRFRRSLAAALALVGPRVPEPVAEVYGALGIAPLRDVLGRLPWRPPPPAVRTLLVGHRPAPAPRAGSLFVKPLWPTAPVWPQPLGENDPATSTGLFPAELLTPPRPGRVSHHEATTAPMPKVRDEARTGPIKPFVLSAPVPADVLDDPRDSLFVPRPVVREPVYLLPEQHAPEPVAEPEVADEPEAPAVPERRVRPVRFGERHYDWAWELAGFVICVAIAMLVFFSIPTIITP
ncbi:hypothetical protein [Nonomuraea sp. NPDC046570]|uniref:RNA polymerase sigma factor n=1 Tax=Nonomuraea sp. NPDC046570 TaxID=3155255 RepID=UPI00340DD083